MVLCIKVGKGSRQNRFLSSRKGLAEREGEGAWVYGVGKGVAGNCDSLNCLVDSPLLPTILPSRFQLFNLKGIRLFN
jgi:hypothetical protein